MKVLLECGWVACSKVLGLHDRKSTNFVLFVEERYESLGDLPKTHGSSPDEKKQKHVQCSQWLSYLETPNFLEVQDLE